ncbi:hypothetical protein [Sneathiella glossodoripedis]|uniref:hypothetical protein n=1 Tax=Sneathiella glossodoripedis TaxID=418853 RepID=UPI000471B237|nr:hypothetical protein [Sneathiella glossodoripedis]
MISITSYRAIVGKCLVLMVALVTLAGCVVKPIYNVENRAFSTEEIIPLDDIQRRIKLVGAERGWSFEDVAPGHMIGRVGTYKHNAKVDLYFNQKTFSIKYKESYNLKATDSTIHHRYNRWIEMLERDLVTKIGLVRS